MWSSEAQGYDSDCDVGSPGFRYGGLIDRSALSVRTFVLALVTFCCVSCGFQPVYDSGTASAGLNRSIRLGPMDGRLGFLFRESFEGLTPPTDAPTHILFVEIDVEEEGRAITEDASITRFNLTAIGTYRLVDAATNAEALTGTARSFTAYNATAAPFPTRIAERDAERRVAEDLAGKIRRILAVAAERGQV